MKGMTGVIPAERNVMLSPKQNRALQALLTQSTKTEAAKAAGITPRTMTAYLADPNFQREYKKAYGELVTDAARQAQQSLNPALAALRSIVDDPNQNGNTRIAAARALLEYGLRLTEINDILTVIDDMEGGDDVL